MQCAARLSLASPPVRALDAMAFLRRVRRALGLIGCAVALLLLAATRERSSAGSSEPQRVARKACSRLSAGIGTTLSEMARCASAASIVAAIVGTLSPG